MIYADAAASALKFESVIAAQLDFIRNHYANEGRGICKRAAYADDMVVSTRKKVADFTGAKDSQIVFTSGSTDGLNRISRMLNLTPESVVAVSDLDHHSARLPFEELARLGKCKIWVCPLTVQGNIDPDALRERCGHGDVAAVVITAMSNVLGVPQNLPELIKACGDAITIVDAAQYASHEKMNANDFGCDFLVYSAHKLGADTGLGILYMKDADKWPPVNFGGGMVTSVDGHEWVIGHGVDKHEAGTLPLSQIAGLAGALETFNVQSLTDKMRAELEKIPGIIILSPIGASLVSFVSDKLSPLDVGALLGARDICVRAGNMCASWIHKHLGIKGSVRISFGPWNTPEDVAEIAAALRQVFR
jgi:cysteine desulfurase/selenocysteine lyase